MRHLRNLVAKDIREGEVYHRLVEKLKEQREALAGQVLGELRFEDRPLRELFLDAILYEDRPDIRARLLQVVDRTLRYVRPPFSREPDFAATSVNHKLTELRGTEYGTKLNSADCR